LRRLALGWRRAVARALPLALIALLVAVVVAAHAASLGHATVGSDAGVRDVLGQADTRERSIQIATRLHADPDAQDQAVMRHVGRLFPGVPLDVHRSLQSQPEPIAPVDDAPPRDDRLTAALATYDGIAAHATLQQGSWPDADLEVTVHAEAAEVLGLGVGSRVALARSVEDVRADRTLTVVGTWMPADAAAAFWFADDLELLGQSGSRLGPFVVTDATMQALHARASVRWRLDPDLDRLTAADARTLHRGVPRVRPRMENDPAIVTTALTVTGDLEATLDRAVSRVLSGRGVAASAIGLLALAGVVALWQVARLLSRLRAGETGLLRARGASWGQLSWWGLREAAVVVVPMAVLGIGVAAVVVRQLGGTAPEVIWTVGGVAGVVALCVLGAVAAVAAAQARGSVRAERAGRVRSVAAGGGALLVIVGAVASLWQLRRFGSPVVAGSDSLDVLATAAPALFLLAVGLLALALLGPLAAGAQRVLAGRRGLGAVLPIRQVGRRLPVFAVPVLLVVVAVGSITLAASYAASWEALQHQVAEHRAGMDVRVRLDADGFVLPTREPVTAGPYRELDGVDEAVPVVTSSARVRDAEVSILALPPAHLPRISEVSLDGAGSAAGVPVPGDGGEVEARVRVRLDARNPFIGSAEDGQLPADFPPELVQLRGLIQLQLTLVDEDGVAALVRLGDVEVPEPTPEDLVAVEEALTVVGNVPPGRWSLTGVTMSLQLGFAWQPVVADVALVGLRTSAGDADLRATGPWSVRSAPPGQPAVIDSEHGIGVRRVPGADGGPGTQDGVVFSEAIVTPRSARPGPPKVLATPGLLAHLDAQVGDTLSMRAFGADIQLRVAGVVPVIPGVAQERALLVDRSQLTAMLTAAGASHPVTNEVWISSSDPAATVVAARQVVSGRGEAISAAEIAADLLTSPASRQAVVVFWLVAAVVALLAVVGVLVAAAVVASQRRAELAVLRALGMSAGQQARTRTLEQVAITIGAGLVGLGAGWGASYLVAGLLAGAATPTLPQGLQPEVRMAVGPWLWAVGSLLAALVVAAVGHGRAAARQARVVVPREDAS
jgi:hypothetical protein